MRLTDERLQDIDNMELLNQYAKSIELLEQLYKVTEKMRAFKWLDDEYVQQFTEMRTEVYNIMKRLLEEVLNRNIEDV